MAITDFMAKKTIRSTFALDPYTVEALDRLADKWQVSKSEALRTIIETAARVEEVDASADALAALDELQSRLALTDDRAEEWIRQIREIRAGFGQ